MYFITKYDIILYICIYGYNNMDRKHKQLDKYLKKLKISFIYEKENDNLLILRKDDLKINLVEFSSFPKNIFIFGTIYLDYKNSNIELNSVYSDSDIYIKNYHYDEFHTSTFSKSIYFSNCDFKSIQSYYIDKTIMTKQPNVLNHNTIYLDQNSTLFFTKCPFLKEINLDLKIRKLEFIDTPELEKLSDNITVDFFKCLISKFKKLPDNLYVKKNLIINNNPYIKNINNIVNHSFQYLDIDYTGIDELPDDLKTTTLKLANSQIKILNPKINISIDRPVKHDHTFIEFNINQFSNFVYNTKTITMKNQIKKHEHLSGFITFNNIIYFIDRAIVNFNQIKIDKFNTKSIFTENFLAPDTNELLYSFFKKNNINDIFYFTYISKVDKIKELVEDFKGKDLCDPLGNSIFKYVRDIKVLNTLCTSSIFYNSTAKENLLPKFHNEFDKLFLIKETMENVSNFEDKNLIKIDNMVNIKQLSRTSF